MYKVQIEFRILYLEEQHCQSSIMNLPKNKRIIQPAVQRKTEKSLTFQDAISKLGK